MSWSAIVAGAVAAAAVTIILLVIGTGIGLSTVLPWYGTGASAATVGIAALVWLVGTDWIVKTKTRSAGLDKDRLKVITAAIDLANAGIKQEVLTEKDGSIYLNLHEPTERI